jgi:quercetin dioxygenase-like cupin family protein
MIQGFTGLRAPLVILTIFHMRTSRVTGLVFLATAALVQQQQSVEITSEPSHHLVFQNEYVRVFDVTVAPKATTLIHKHNYDYLFVTLGDSDVVSERVGAKPAALQLKDGEVRFTPGNFAHAAINKSDRPFHNITIEMLKPSSNVKICTGNCVAPGYRCAGICADKEMLISSDQWTAWGGTLPPSAFQQKGSNSLPQLLIAVSDLDLKKETGGNLKRTPGGLEWVPVGAATAFTNNGTKWAQFITLEFKQGKPNP